MLPCRDNTAVLKAPPSPSTMGDCTDIQLLARESRAGKLNRTILHLRFVRTTETIEMA